MHSFLITFNPLRHGWTDARVTLQDGQVFDFVVSNVPNDAIGDTVAALASLAAGSAAPQTVSWSLEPGFVMLTFLQDGDDIVLEVQPGASSSTRTARGTREAVLLDHWRSFRRLSTHQAWQDSSVWPPGFPQRDVELLGKALGR